VYFSESALNEVDDARYTRSSGYSAGFTGKLVSLTRETTVALNQPGSADLVKFALARAQAVVSPRRRHPEDSPRELILLGSLNKATNKPWSGADESALKIGHGYPSDPSVLSGWCARSCSWRTRPCAVTSTLWTDSKRPSPAAMPDSHHSRLRGPVKPCGGMRVSSRAGNAGLRCAAPEWWRLPLMYATHRKTPTLRALCWRGRS
jgi:hypothetical protein